MLRTLRREGRRLVTEELASGAVSRWDEDTWRPLTDEREQPISLDELDEHLARVMRDHEPFDPAIDAALAPRLHQALPLSRRDAADLGVWRFLAVAHAPELVRHRWEHRSWAVARTRFWAGGTRHTANAFGRLWWIAELTRQADSYELTTRVLGKPSLATVVFARTWSQHRPAVEAFVDVVRDESVELAERVAFELGRHLAVVPLERLDHAELVRIVRAVANAG